jgi:hypothetical protein
LKFYLGDGEERQGGWKEGGEERGGKGKGGEVVYINESSYLVAATNRVNPLRIFAALSCAARKENKARYNSGQYFQFSVKIDIFIACNNDSCLVYDVLGGFSVFLIDLLVVLILRHFKQSHVIARLHPAVLRAKIFTPRCPKRSGNVFSTNRNYNTST